MTKPKFSLHALAEFLDGSAPLDGVWFGERHVGEGGVYWWRKHLRAAMDADRAREMDAEKGGDANVEAVRAKLLHRSRVGLAKYGVTTERTDLTQADWLTHLQEELMDACVYIEAARLNELSGNSGQLATPPAQAAEAVKLPILPAIPAGDLYQAIIIDSDCIEAFSEYVQNYARAAIAAMQAGEGTK